MPESGKLENPYDVQFILMGQDLNVETVRNRIDAMGDSTVVVGDETTIKVHIHVKDPGEPIDGHGAKNSPQTIARHFLEPFAHHRDAEEKKAESTKNG